MEYTIKSLTSCIVSFNKVLSEHDWDVIREDFYFSFNRGYIEKLSINTIIFIVPSGMQHTLMYYLTKEYKNHDKDIGKLEIYDLLSRINYVDENIIISRSV